ncbi:unnamed protein product [Diatraea saccharalis]|uniref:GYF domain-containing protein n=1 Tax=Diatraea saccharalis TaxID=40085 RepID=A0A9P0C4Q7_9NEOP|nr:unnamed protein product [Diatraea saccharalis]
MGDRNNPIKFGPEWLRNLAREGNTGTSGNNIQSAMSPNSANTGATGSSSGGNAASGSNSGNTSNTSQNISPKVQLAKLRYGREEMLALYDRTSEAPPELKFIELLYQPRGKAPFALNNTFEDEIQRENMRSGPPIGSISPGERFGIGRGMGRGLSVSDGRGRPRMPFVRSPSTGRGSTASWHLGSPRTPGYNAGVDDDTSLNPRSPWSGGNGSNAVNRSSGEQAEWTPSKMFRSKRQGLATNWRQSREEGEEWRSSDAGRRSNQQDKWERDWSDRPTQDKPQNWNSNRRTWVGGETQNSDDLPEWAMDNAEACGGTFDSSGAFHGFSNDDTNIPKTPESTYPLIRSHTHGSFARSKTVEEGSEEWWASEKAKKLSPKRFDASDVKFKKQLNTPEASTDTGTDSKPSTSKHDDLQEIPEKIEKAVLAPEPSENASGGLSDDEKFNNKNSYKSKFPTESKTFDSHMRSEINLDEANESQERGNFQSVMITPNNSLRQKHQNIVSSASDVSRESNINRDKQTILQLLQNAPTNQALEIEMRKQQQASEDKIVDEIFDMTLEDKDVLSKNKTIANPLNQSNTSSISSPIVNSMPHMQNSQMQLRLSSPVYPNQGMPMSTKSNIPNPGMPSGLQGMPTGMHGVLPSGMQLQSGLQMGGLPQALQQVTGIQALNMQVNMHQGGGNQQQGSSLQSSGMQQSSMPGNIQTPSLQSGMQNTGIQNSGMTSTMQPSLQSVGMTNSALNASLGLPIGPVSNAMGLPLQGIPPPVLQNSGMNTGMGGPGLQGLGPGSMQSSSTGISGYPNSGLLGMSSPNVAIGMTSPNVPNSSLFIGQNSTNPSIGTSGDIPMPNNHGNQSNIFPIHGLQHSGSQATFGSSIYSNIMQQPPSQPPPTQNLADQWYYEDPEKNIQGPFTSKEMYKWYRAGFFSPNLMVRRACDAHMRPLGSYGPVAPFSQMDMMSSFPLSGGFDRSPGPHDPILNSQQNLGLESVDSLWSQPSPSNDLMWVQQAMSGRNDSRVNNLPMFFWDQQPTTIASNSIIPEDIAKEMKTEDQILAQLRASQNISTPQGVSFMNEQPAAMQPSGKSEETFTPAATLGVTPNLEELQKLIQKDTLAAKPSDETSDENVEVQQSSEKTSKSERTVENKSSQMKSSADAKQTKQTKGDNEKTAKNKENSTKSKSKKKEEKKEELESKTKEDNVKTEKRSEETSPAKSKKEDKLNKKDLEKEKKEWLKEGFTIVKGSEKSVSKDNKKKVEENKIAEETERRRKEEEKLALEEEKKRKQAETIKNKEIQQQQQQQRQAMESVAKKAPWSALANQTMLATNKDGLTLAEIQRLEREKKLEQMKEQQQMMQIIAQQQAAALAREQEMQAGLGWAKKKGTNFNVPGQSLAEIQAEARKQAAATAAAVAAAAATQALEEAAAQPQPNHVPWGSAPNGGPANKGGFWDTQPNPPNKAEKSQESPKTSASDQKAKKKAIVNLPAKKETSPAAEFETWCTTVLTSWSSKIDVPTFVGFLKDIESPYEVKDYVKCYLGESKDSNDFARNFLERRSKLLRVGMVTPSDDLCSPAMAVNPRTQSGSDYQEGKGKKTKKNKMLKVDARILGFSVTAAEDRINVGDIDTV